MTGRPFPRLAILILREVFRASQLDPLKLVYSFFQSRFLKINFYWSIVNLQCCVIFCYTAQWISYTYTHPFLDSFPMQAIIKYWVEFSVLCSRFLLVIYNSVYMSIPVSQFIPPSSLSSLVILFSISVTLFLFCRWVHLYSTLSITCKWYHMMFVFLCLTYFTQHDNL